MNPDELNVYQLRVENYEKGWTEIFYLIPRNDEILMYGTASKGLSKKSNPLQHGWHLRTGGDVSIRSLHRYEVKELLEEKGLAKLLEKES